MTIRQFQKWVIVRWIAPLLYRSPEWRERVARKFEEKRR